MSQSYSKSKLTACWLYQIRWDRQNDVWCLRECLLYRISHLQSWCCPNTKKNWKILRYSKKSNTVESVSQELVVFDLLFWPSSTEKIVHPFTELYTGLDPHKANIIQEMFVFLLSFLFNLLLPVHKLFGIDCHNVLVLDLPCRAQSLFKQRWTLFCEGTQLFLNW